MSIPSVQAAARAAPAAKAVVRTADFKAALARAQATFEPVRPRAAAQAEAPVPAASRAAFASMERRMRDFAGPASQLSAAVSGGVSPSS